MGDLNFILLIEAIVNNEESRQLRLYRRQIRDASNPLSIPEAVFKSTYRFTRATAHYLIEEITPFIPEIVRQEMSLPSHLIIMTAFHFYAQGSYQKSIAQDINMPMSQSSVSRCISIVTNILNEQFHNFIQFPSTDDAKTTEKIKFMDMPNGFPGIIGAIDCTHISIQAPPTNDENYPGLLFYNRKHFYSLNVQVIVAADMRILGINPRFPGSVHDSAIWSMSQIREHLLDNYLNGRDHSSYLLGDSGYPLEPWLINVFSGHNLNDRERQYNASVRSLRNIVERVFGILKTRFRCCFGHRTMEYHPTKAAKIINACAILHNILLNRRDLINEIEQVNNIVHEENHPENRHQHDNHNWLNEGRLTRQRIIDTYF